MKAVLVIAVLTACGGKKQDPKIVEQALAVPTVSVAAVLAKEPKQMPHLLVVGDADARIAGAASWEAFDKREIVVAKNAAPVDALIYRMKEDFLLGKPATATVEQWDKDAESEDGVEIDLATLEELPPPSRSDDPPPPEDELPADEESGGTGTAMALEEGKMGRKDSDRAEGQYKMKRTGEPNVPRKERPKSSGGAFEGLTGTGDREALSRLSKAEGYVMDDLEPMRTLILIAPTAKATRLIEVVSQTEGAIAVAHNGKVRALRLQFDLRGADRLPGGQWIEARVTAKGVTIEAVPDKPIETTDLAQLAAALKTAREARGYPDLAPVDVLVDPAIDAQRLIDVIVAVDRAGVRSIGLGPLPDAAALAKRGKRFPRVSAGMPSSMGELDKALIRRVVKANLAKVSSCYEKGLAINADLSGTVMVQFVIAPTGAVSSSSATGVDAEVASCVAAAVKAFEFPKPKGGGQVQVNYPFTMQP